LRTNRDSAIQIRPVKLRKQPPALTTTRKDRAMADKADITPDLIRQLIRFEPETGKYFWRERPRDMFDADRSYNWWNTRFSNKETLNVKSGTGYLCVDILGRNYKAHRVIWAYHHGEWPAGQIDHINGDRCDNRLSNLRVVTNAINSKNRRAGTANTSGFVGVGWLKVRKKWGAQIMVNGKTISLGRFSDIADAIDARKIAEVRFGFHPNHGSRA
jgi:hypothetical protein